MPHDADLPPEAHKASHLKDGSDAIKIDELDVAGDNTNLDASITAHGLMSKADKIKLEAIQAGAQVNAWITSPSKFRVHQNAAGRQDIVTATATKLLWAAEAYDIGGDFDLANSKYVAPAEGYYHFDWAARVSENLGDQKHIVTYLYVNQVLRVTANYSYSALAAGRPTSSSSAEVYLEANDEVEIYLYHDAGVNREIYDVVPITWFNGHRI